MASSAPQPRQENPFRGGLAPATEEVTALDLPVTGRIPAELNGRYLRNGPNPRNLDDPRLHLFLGDGMVHGVRLRDGRAEWYRNRWVRSAEVAEGLGEQPPAGGATVNFADFASNTHVIGHAGRTLALVEAGPRPYELDYRLGTVGRFDFLGTLPGGYTAHPKLDPVTGELHAVSYQFGTGVVQYTVVSAQGRVVRSLDIPAEHGPMMHDFALTRRHIVLYDLPVVQSMEAVEAGAPLPYVWEEGRPARLGLLPRDAADAAGADAVRWFEIDPCWIFHTLNAHDGEDGTSVTVDAVGYGEMFRGARLSGPLPTLDRWTLDTTSGKAVHTRLDDRPQEFPTVSPRTIGTGHRYGYAAATRALFDVFTPGSASGPGAATATVTELDALPDEAFGNALIKHDLRTGGSEVRPLGRDAHAAEAAFVPAEHGTAEDDGYLLTFVHDPERGASDLLVLSAQDFTGAPLAAVHLPARVPLGFHGSWVPDAVTPAGS
jgi:carotenoid cleavage dioxygenase